MSVKQKVKDTLKLMLDIGNTDLILRQKVNIPLHESKRLRSNNASQKSSTLYGHEIAITSAQWHLHSLKEIFLEETYKFTSPKPNPVIIDCGANIGLSIIYFKKLFPQAIITGFEADPHIFQILENNLATFKYNNVTLYNQAVWKEETVMQFGSGGALGGTLNVDAKHHSPDKVTEIQAIRLKDYLNQPVDFLKIDIEGAESEVLHDCADSLHQVENLFVEYHSAPGQKQHLPHLLAIMEKAGFRIYIKEAWNNRSLPFVPLDYQPFWDLQLNIYGYRPH